MIFAIVNGDVEKLFNRSTQRMAMYHTIRSKQPASGARTRALIGTPASVACSGARAAGVLCPPRAGVTGGQTTRYVGEYKPENNLKKCPKTPKIAFFAYVEGEKGASKY